MNVLTLESLDKLRDFVRGDPDFRELMSCTMTDLAADLNLTFVDLEIESLNRELPELELREVLPQSLATTDVENAPNFFEALSDLSPAHATDERIWATLAIGVYSEYTSYRWQLIPEDEEKARNWVTAHWLCGAANRSKFRDNAISRLWWMGKIAHSIPGWTPKEVSEVMITNTDYRQQLLDRTSSFTATGVAKAVLELSREIEKSGTPLTRDEFRQVMKEINFVAGKSNLAVLSPRQLIDLFQPIFGCQVTARKPKTVLQKLFSAKD